MARISEVRKRDTRIVPFDQSKISDAIYKAIRSVGGGDNALANDLAAAVTLFLEKKFSGEIPNIEDIQDMVETVLAETGHDEIAQAYIAYRHKRSKIREILHVHKTASEGPEVETSSTQPAKPWRKANIVAALVKEADVEVSVAEDIAAVVEEKVFNAGIRRIATSLIRELVDNELFERGYAAKLKKQAPIGFPKYNLEQVLFSVDAKEPYSFAKDPEDIDLLVSKHILHQYALEEIYSQEVSEAAKDGRILIHRPGEPLKPYRIILSGKQAGHPKHGVSTRLLRLLKTVGQDLIVPFPKDPVHHRELALIGYNKRTLVLAADKTSPFLPLPDHDGPERHLRYALFIQPDDPPTEAQLKEAARYFARGSSVDFRLGTPPAAGLTVAKVSLNLPQLAFRSGRTRLGDIFGEVDMALALAIKALLERRSFMARAAHTPDLPLWELIGRHKDAHSLEQSFFAIGLFGLSEAVKFISGKEIFQDAGTFQFGRQLIQHIAEKIQRESKGLAIQLLFEETIPPHLLAEQAHRDARRFPEMQEILRGRPDRTVYTGGVRLPQQAPIDPITRNEYLARLSPYIQMDSIIEEHNELGPGEEDLVLSLLEESIPLFASPTEETPTFSH